MITRHSYCPQHVHSAYLHSNAVITVCVDVDKMICSNKQFPGLYLFRIKRYL